MTQKKAKSRKPREDRTNKLPANEQILVPVSEWENYFAWPSESALRHLIFDADTNGFRKCIRRVNKRILIHVPSFYKWVDKQDQTQN